MAGPAGRGKDAVVAYSPKDPQFLSHSLNTGTTRYSRSCNSAELAGREFVQPEGGPNVRPRAVRARTNAAADAA
jgi:hypothetical protein